MYQIQSYAKIRPESGKPLCTVVIRILSTDKHISAIIPLKKAGRAQKLMVEVAKQLEAKPGEVEWKPGLTKPEDREIVE